MPCLPCQSQKNVEVEEAPVEGHFTPHPSDVLDMPVDPNEPTYCLCHQVSYGEMIGCDNNDCPIGKIFSFLSHTDSNLIFPFHELHHSVEVRLLIALHIQHGLIFFLF
jgi:hypothetical protein